MTTTMTKRTNLEKAKESARLASLGHTCPTMVWQVGVDSFIIAHCAIEGVLVGIWINGVLTEKK